MSWLKNTIQNSGIWPTCYQNETLNNILKSYRQRLKPRLEVKDLTTKIPIDRTSNSSLLKFQPLHSNYANIRNTFQVNVKKFCPINLQASINVENNLQRRFAWFSPNFSVWFGRLKIEIANPGKMTMKIHYLLMTFVKLSF